MLSEDLQSVVISPYSHIVLMLRTNKLDSHRSDALVECISFTMVCRYIKYNLALSIENNNLKIIKINVY